MNKFIYLFTILGALALSTAQIVEPGVSNDGTAVTENADEIGFLPPFEDDLPVDGDSDYFKNGEDYGGIYEGYFEDAEGLVSTPDDINDDFGFVEDPIIAEEAAGLVDVAEPLNEEDATIGEPIVEPSEDFFQFNQIPNDALDSDVGEDFYDEGVVDSPDDVISEEGFIGLPDALINFEEAVVGEPEALIDLEEGKTGSSDDFGEVSYPDDLTESDEDFSEALIDYPDDLTESGEDFSEALVDYPDNLSESGEDVYEALVDYPDDLVESGDDSSEAVVDTQDGLFESGEVTVDIPEAYVGEPEDITDAAEVDEPEDETDAGEVDEPEDITDAAEVDEPEDDTTDAAEVDEPEDETTDAAEVDEPEDDTTDAAEVDEPEDNGEGFAVELDPRVLDTNEDDSTTDGQGYAVQLDGVEQAEEKSKNFLG